LRKSVVFLFSMTHVLRNDCSFNIMLSVKNKIKLAAAFFIALLGIVVIRWAVIRWHHQDLMAERLNILYIHRDSQNLDSQALIDEQWDQVEYYLKHPLKLDPRMPNAFNIKTRPSFWEHMILPFKVKEIQKLRETLSQSPNMDNNPRQ